jgi:Transglutaminase-like superfamily
LRVHRLISAFCVGLASVAGSLAVAGEAIPTPSVDGIDYSHPEKYVDVCPSYGNIEKIRQIAGALRSGSAEDRIAAIGRWIDRNVKYDPKAPYVSRNFDAIVNSNGYGGCANHSILFSALARASGIPTVTVKTMDADWIREFRKTGATGNWNGHVFLEVFFDGHWHLLNATELRLYDDYDPAMRILPGNRYAYDKGSDPFQLVLSADWERWKIQTTTYFANFDVSKLPLGPGREVGAEDSVYIAADSPVYQAISERVLSLGYRPRTCFNTDFETYLPKAKGKILVETCVGNRVVPPVEAYGPYIPLTREELNKRIADVGPGIARKRLSDGTRVVLLYSSDVPKLLEMIRTMELWPGS